MAAFADCAGFVEVVVGSSVVLVVLELVLLLVDAAWVVGVVPEAARDLPSPPASAEEQAASAIASATPAAVLPVRRRHPVSCPIVRLWPRSRVSLLITAFDLSGPSIVPHFFL